MRSEEEVKLALACCMSDLSKHGPNPIGMQLTMLCCWILGSPYPRLQASMIEAKKLSPEVLEEWIKLAETLNKQWATQINFQANVLNTEPKEG